MEETAQAPLTDDTIVIPKSQYGRSPEITYGMIKDRTARCPHCKRTRPSAEPYKLAFFEYRGPGNNDRCDICHVIPGVHDGTGLQGEPLRPNSFPARLLAQHPEHEYTDAEGAEYDSFYCGCRGWD